MRYIFTGFLKVEGKIKKDEKLKINIFNRCVEKRAQKRRNAGICKRLEAQNDFIFEKSGARINTVFSGSRMAWILENCPEVCEKLYKFVNIPEYIMHHMTGEYKTDVTYASRSHLMNLRTRKWDSEMLQLFGICVEQLCEIEEPGSVCGTVTVDFANKTGIPKGIPVITSGGDQQCAAIGQGAYKEGTLSLVAGTGGFLVTALDEVPKNPDARAHFGGISLADSRGDLAKGLLEGIFMEIRNNILLFGEYTEIDRAYISGGLTNSPVINQLQADVYGISLYHMEDSESTAFGALMVSLTGQGVYASLEEAFLNVRGNTTMDSYQPSLELFTSYEKKRKEMNKMYERLY